MSQEEITLSDRFRSVFSQHPGAVSLITAWHDETPVGFTATSVISVSAEPAVVVFSIMNTSSCYSALAGSDLVSIHLLEAHHEALARQFSSKGIDRFVNIELESHPHRAPIISEVNRRLDCRIVNRVAAGSSTLLVCEVTDIHSSDGSPALVYANRSFGTLARPEALTAA